MKAHALLLAAVSLGVLSISNSGWAMGPHRPEGPEAPDNAVTVSIADLTEMQQAFLYSSQQQKSLPGACAIEYIRSEPVTVDVPGFSFSVRTTHSLHRWVDAKAHRFEKSRDADGNIHVVYERGETETRCILTCSETAYLRSIEMTYAPSGRILEISGREEDLNLKSVTSSHCRGSFDPIPEMKNSVELTASQADQVRATLKQLEEGKLKLAGKCQLKKVDFEMAEGALGRFIFETPQSGSFMPQVILYGAEHEFNLKEEDGQLSIEAAHVYPRPSEGSKSFYGYDRIRTRLEVDFLKNSMKLRQDGFNGLSTLDDADAVEHLVTLCE